MPIPTLSRKLAVLDTRSARPAPKVADRFYTGPRAWRNLVERLKRERGDRCEVCGRTGTRIYGDHVVELKDGGPRLDPRNVTLKCGSCHQTKSAAVRAGRALV